MLRHRSLLAVAALVVLVASARALQESPPQEPPPAPPKPEAPAKAPKQGAPEPKPDAPIVPAPGIRPPPNSKGPVANRPIPSVERFREGKTAPVSRASSYFDLDLARVDLTRDPVLVVEGEPIRRADVDRQLCFMLGHNEIEQFVTGVLLRSVKKQMLEAGQPIPAVAVTEDDVAKKFEEDKKVLPQMRGMTPEEFERQIREVFGWEQYVEFQKQQMEFEGFFLPDPPAEWAKKQQAEAKRLDDEHQRKLDERAKAEAAEQGGEGGGEGDAKPASAAKKPVEEPPTPEADLSFVPSRTWELLDPRFVDVLKKNYARGNSLHPLFRGGIMQTIRKKLLEGVVVRPARADEPDAVVWCADEAFRSQDLLALVSPRVDDHARRLALRELVNLRAADVRLAQDGVLPSDADAEESYRTFQQKFANTLIPAEYAVTAFGFNSMWHYRPYFRRKGAYVKLVERDMTEEKLADYYDRAGRVFFENGTCISQVLFVPGPDRAAAKAEIDALLAEVAAGKPFAAIAREKGRFPDGGDVHGGAIAPLIRGKLRTALGESEYTSFLTGHSLADEAFYAAKDDAIIGPVWRDLSPKLTGWMALHVDRFFTSGAKGPLTDPKMRERALDDYADVTFPNYVNESLGRCRVDVPE